MPKPYSYDLRQKVIQAVKLDGLNISSASRIFSIVRPLGAPKAFATSGGDKRPQKITEKGIEGNTPPRKNRLPGCLLTMNSGGSGMPDSERKVFYGKKERSA